MFMHVLNIQCEVSPNWKETWIVCPIMMKPRFAQVKCVADYNITFVGEILQISSISCRNFPHGN